MPEALAATVRPSSTTGAMLAVRELNAWYGESHILHGVSVRRRRGRGRHAARPQRRGQDDDAQVDHGRGARDARARSRSKDARRSDFPRTGSRGSASRSAPRSAGSSRASNVEENLLLPPQVRRRRAQRRADLRAFPEPARAASAARAPSCRAASSRCSRSAASCAPARGCCCSTSRPKVWRR